MIEKYENRKYLNLEERVEFRKEAVKANAKVKMFSLLLYYTGIRISEGLNILVSQIDFDDSCIVIRSLKKRKIDYRRIPMPIYFLKELDEVFRLKERQADQQERRKRIWRWTRNTAYLKIKKIMRSANIVGLRASPKGLRHSFAIACLLNDIPLKYIQKWMGHNSLEMTALYANVLGKEERLIASKAW